MKKNNSFKHLVLFTLFAIVFALASVFFVPAKNIASADDFSVVIENQVLTSVDGDFTGSKIENEEDVLEYLNNFKSDFGFDDAKDNLKFNKTVQSLIGNVFQFNQYVDGLKVYGGELNVGINKSKRIKSIDGKYYINLAYDKNIAIVESEGLGIAKGVYQDAEIYFEETVILPEGECVAYIFLVAKTDESLRIFINASTGQIVKEVGVNSAARSSIYASGYNTSAETIEVSIDGNDVELPVTKYTSTNGGGYFYALADASVSKIYTTKGNKNNNANDMSTYTYTCYDSANNSTNPAADFTDEDSLKAYNSLLTCYNFYKDEDSFGISIDGIKNKNGQRIDLIAIVHFGSSYENAGYVEPAYNNYTHKYETYGYFIFGDGKSGSTRSFVNGLDIVGHEYQHAMTSSIVALEYSKESGALSEAFSDIFGAVIEGKGISSPDFWKLGEDVVLSSSSGAKYLRNMANPSATGCVSDYSQVAYYTNRTSDYGGVHYVCTLPTYATYLMYKKAPEFFNEYNILRLWYQTLSHLTTTSGIDDFCAGMMRAADELELSNAMKNVIEYAFATVGVPGYYGTKTWNNNGLTTFQGAGTIASPYLIKTVADLASLAYYVNSGEPAHAEYLTARYKLDADLDLGGVSWLAIGTATNPFNGYFNGASHTITGLNLEGKQGDSFNGLFAYVGESGFIYDLKIGLGNTTAKTDYVGAIAGRMLGSISGCSSQLAITGKNVGGLVGLMINKDGGQKVANCFVKADLVGEKVGGLICTFATEKNQNDNLYESAYVTSSYYQGKITALNGGGILAEGNAIYLVNNLVYATFDGKNNQALFGGLVANLSCNNPTSLEDATNVYNYVLTNRTYANFTNTTQANCGLIAGFVYGSAAVGQALISGNIAKTVSGINFVYSIEDESSTKLEDNKLSNDVIFSGDFDFDNASYYENQDWTVLSQSASFDLVGTFKIVNKNMPSFKDMDFWLNVSGYSFAGGNGTKNNPYQIATAEQLASLSSLLLPQLKYSDFFGYYYDYENYNNYSSAYYILTDDIDLGGKVWSGLGYAIYSFENDEINRNSSYTKTYFFTGSFDGNGHVIKNMKSLGVYSIGGQSNDGHSYLLYEFMPGLFGYTLPSSDNVPTVKNLTLENVEISGNYAAAVVSRAYVALNLENVKVMGGTVTSSGTAGGLVGRIEGYTNLTYSDPIVNIKDCYTVLNISANIAGGAVGYATNGTYGKETTLNIINYLGRNNINVIGLEKETDAGTDVSYPTYYKAIGGHVVGVTAIKNLNIINTIVLGDIVSYTKGAYMGAYIGAIGSIDPFVANSVNISVDACKHVGAMYYVFNKDLVVGGTIVGGTHASYVGMVNLSVNDKTFTNQTTAAIYYNNSTSISVSAQPSVSEDEKGTGDFDFNNEEYFADENYFNLNYAWSEENIKRFGFVVTFMLEDGTILKQQIVKDGASVEAPATNPTKESTAAYDFVFAGYDKDFSAIYKDTTIYAVFEPIVREYEVSYEDENGNLLAVMKLDFGASVDQDIKIEKEKSNLFVKYTFVRFGEKGQTVAGDMTVKPVYKTEITTFGVIVIVALISSVIISLYVLSKKRQYVR